MQIKNHFCTTVITLKEPAANQTIVTLAENYISQGADVRDIRSLAILADGLGETSNAFVIFLPTPSATLNPEPTTTPTSPPTATPSPTNTLQATPTPENTSTPSPTPIPNTVTPSPTPVPNTATPSPIPTPKRPTPTPNEGQNPTITPRPTSIPGQKAPFQLAQSVALCDNTADGVLRIYVRDEDGNGIPGIEVIIRWPEGEDHFFTGFKSDFDPGYADFQMEQDQVYQAELKGVSGVTASDINQAAMSRCPELPQGIAPSWQIVFLQDPDR